MLDAVIDYLPSPLDIPPVKGTNPDNDNEVERPADDDAPLSALVFKIVTDPYVGRLAYFRVYSGTVHPGHDGLQLDQGQTRADWPLAAHVCRPPRRYHRSLCGDIAAVLGLKKASPAIPCATSTTRSYWKTSPSLNRSSRWQLNQRRPPTRKKWVKPAQTVGRRSDLPGSYR